MATVWLFPELHLVCLCMFRLCVLFLQNHSLCSVTWFVIACVLVPVVFLDTLLDDLYSLPLKENLIVVVVFAVICYLFVAAGVLNRIAVLLICPST